MVVACNFCLYINTQPVTPVVVSSDGGVRPFNREESSISWSLPQFSSGYRDKIAHWSKVFPNANAKQ